jgi:hypothetical protein
MSITEWELTADVASWFNEIIFKNRILPFSRVKCEQRAEGPSKGRGLTLLDSLGRSIVSGEIKLPYQKDGSSPYIAAVVNDARAKALKASSKYFFTWNVNEFILWETTQTRSIWKDQNYKSWDVTGVQKESDFENPAVIDALKRWLPVFLDDFVKIIQGTASIGKKSPDEKFIDSLKSALKMPVLATLDELDRRCNTVRDKSELDLGIRSDQDTDDAGANRDDLEQAARFPCYDLLNKLVFHEALFWRHASQIDKISVPEHIVTGEGLRSHLEGYFAEALRINGDYEAVFGKDLMAFGNRIPFYSDVAVPYWRDLIGLIHEFDFSELDNELIENILERLISPEERHKFDQFNASPGQKEDKAVAKKNVVKRPSRAKPEDVAAQVFEEIKSTWPRMLRQYGPDFLDMQEPFDTFELPKDGVPERYRDLFKNHGVVFKKGKKRVAFIETKNPSQDELVIEVAQSGTRGVIHLPREDEECRRVLDLFTGFIVERRQVIRELIENRTANEKMQGKVYAEVMRFILNQGTQPI